MWWRLSAWQVKWDPCPGRLNLCAMKKRELAHEDRHVLCIYKSRNEEAQYMCSGTTCMKAFWALICKCFWALAHVQVFSVSTEKQVWKLLRQSFVKGHISSEVPRTAALNDLTHRNSNQPETSRSRQTCSVNDYVLIARRLQGADLMREVCRWYFFAYESAQWFVII